MTEVRYVDFRDVPLTRDEWLLDHGRVLKGEFNVLAGPGGSGKTTTAAAWVAELSHRQIRVVYVGERSVKAIRKRLAAAGADFDYVQTIDLAQFKDLARSIGMIRQMVDDGVSVLVLDPLNHFLPGSADSHKDGSLRAALRPLSDMMSGGKLTVLALHHVNKDGGAHAAERLSGSAFYRDFPANVLGMGQHPDAPGERAVIQCLKTNADDGTLNGQLVYEKRLVEVAGEGGQRFLVARSVMVGTRDETGGDVFKRPDPADMNLTDKAQEFLERALMDGPHPVKELQQLAAGVGLNKAALDRAKERIGISPSLNGFGGVWTWQLPAAYVSRYTPSEDVSPAEASSLGISDDLWPDASSLGSSLGRSAA